MGEKVLSIPTCPYTDTSLTRPILGKVISDAKRNGVRPEGEKGRFMEGREDRETREKDLRSAIAVYSEAIVDGATSLADEYPPYGLIEITYDADARRHIPSAVTTLESRRPFNTVREGLNRSLNHVASNYSTQYYRNPEKFQAENPQVFSAIRTLEVYFPADPNILIGNGIGTATGTMSNTLELIEQLVAQRDGVASISPDRLVGVSRKNTEFINTLSSGKKSFVPPLLHLAQGSNQAVGSRPFIPENFDLNAEDQIEFSPKFIEELEKTLGPWQEGLGCPAQYSKAVYMLWNREIELARAIWEEKYTA